MASGTKILPAMHPVTIKRGDTWSKTYEFKRKSDGSPIDLTGATVLIQVRKRAGVTPDIDVSGSPAVSIIGVGNNIVSLFVQVDIPAGKYLWDLQVTFPSGENRTYLEGPFTVSDDISR